MKAHRTDGVSLTFALFFLALAAWWLLSRLVNLALPAVGWIVALALLLIGGLGLIGALRSSRSAPRSAEPTPADPASADPTLGQPTLADPTLVQPTLADPTLADPTLAEPTLAGRPPEDGFDNWAEDTQRTREHLLGDPDGPDPRDQSR